MSNVNTQLLRPYRMNPLTYKVLGIMERDGGITHMTALHYGIGSITKEIQRLRDSKPVGYRINTVTRKDAEGKKYTRWTMKRDLMNEVAA